MSKSSHIDLNGNEVAKPFIPDREHIARIFAETLRGKTLEQVAGLLTDEFEMASEYVQLLNNGKTCQRMSLLFNPHRLEINAVGGIAIYPALTTGKVAGRAPKPDSFYDGLARAYLAWPKDQNNRNVLYILIQRGLQGTYYANEFPPHVARDLYREFKLGPSSRILDPCAGWGGRMIGASTVSNTYHCYEPATRTAQGLVKLAEHLDRLVKAHGDGRSFDARVAVKPFEDARITASSYDFALTSPPYYDTEEYSDEPTNSLNRYSTFQDWVQGFYFPLIDRTLDALKPGASFVLNVGDRKYPLPRLLREHCAEIGATVRKLPARLTGGKLASMSSQDESAALSRLAGAQGGLRVKGEGEIFFEVHR